jgi:hypothetical protein
VSALRRDHTPPDRRSRTPLSACHQFHEIMALEDFVAGDRRAQDAVDPLGAGRVN